MAYNGKPFIYLDDLLIYSSNFLKLNPSKCQLFQEVEFLGHVVTKDGKAKAVS